MINIPLYLYYDNYNKLLIIISISSIILLYFSMIYIISLKMRNKQLLKDSLTLLPNRFSFNSFCERNKYLSGFALVIDLDNFKKANDFYGHHIGDKIIKQISNYLKQSNNNNIFRISGDEFMMFIKNEKELNIFLKNLN